MALGYQNNFLRVPNTEKSVSGVTFDYMFLTHANKLGKSKYLFQKLKVY